MVRFRLEGGDRDWVLRGVVHLDGQPESILAAIWRRVLKALVREAGV